MYLETALLLLCSPRTPLSLCYWEVVLVMDAGRGQHHHGMNASSASLPSLEKGKYLAVIPIRKKKNRLKPIFGAVHATAWPQHTVPLHVRLAHGCQQADCAAFPLPARPDSSPQLLSGVTKV